jgi:hypothetical protein
MALLPVGASHWYGGFSTTTTSPLRFGCRESEPSTSRSSSFISTFETTEGPSALNAFATAVRTSAMVGKVADVG